jgi:hypothetical protein
MPGRPTANQPVVFRGGMMRSVLLLVGLCGVAAGCSWTGSGYGSAHSGKNGVLGVLTETPGTHAPTLNWTKADGPVPTPTAVAAALQRVGFHVVVTRANRGRCAITVARSEGSTEGWVFGAGWSRTCHMAGHWLGPGRYLACERPTYAVRFAPHTIVTFYGHVQDDQSTSPTCRPVAPTRLAAFKRAILSLRTT